MLSSLNNVPLKMVTKFSIGKNSQVSGYFLDKTKADVKNKETFTDRYNLTAKIGLDDSQYEIIKGNAQ